MQPLLEEYLSRQPPIICQVRGIQVPSWPLLKWRDEHETSMQSSSKLPTDRILRFALTYAELDPSEIYSAFPYTQAVEGMILCAGFTDPDHDL